MCGLGRDWKVMVEEWVNATAAFRGSCYFSHAFWPSLKIECFIPCVCSHYSELKSKMTTSMGFSHFFDGMDDDGNLRNAREFKESNENGRKASLKNSNPVRKQQFAESVTAASKDRKGEQTKKQTSVVKENKPFRGDSGPGRPTKTNI
ncbi:probable mediator of RNA polymerase II transcription subunit 26b isoform X3 [Nicotiana tomentosiformis]|uniref:probable mediator of RNA polymerase II transcription subunit 26b isoform X3 n=1 Tax=Nicotiana tomentosiformis TaxID=4098 RepID=UPI00051B04E0|nr:probable mediator of RNA polymerase II transcription subunit 26b isoform X2 [Nicotiana tomentosiformis]